MRVANVRGRLHLVLDGHIIDVSTASRGVFDADPAKAFARWDELRSWAATCPPEPSAPTLAEVDADLGPPSPLARQTFGIGTNYGDHLREVGWTRPEVPLVFTKYPSCIGAPNASVTLVKGHVDWEAEVVVVIGRGGHHIPKERAWNAVAGLTLGQDISERITQRKPEGNPQHSLGKSYPGFGPIGPVIVSPDEFDDPNDIAFGCELNGKEMQRGRTSDLIYSVPELIAFLSSIVTLLPGDLLFTGTPSGVGHARTPPVFLQVGDRLRTWADGIGEMTQTFHGSA